MSYAPHLSGLRFQQTLARDAPMNPLPTLMDPSTPLNAFGDSTSENVKWVCKKSYYTEYIDDYDLKGHKAKSSKRPMPPTRRTASAHSSLPWPW